MPPSINTGLSCTVYLFVLPETSTTRCTLENSESQRTLRAWIQSHPKTCYSVYSRCSGNPDASTHLWRSQSHLHVQVTAYYC
ncbi:hypothetical protein BV20DRAFT_962685 [Pilatotrama ljubarskyi]|nr:hypothetical protein BV20DRAFT_962685 [Pilatotrama ljubarskyi]